MGQVAEQRPDEQRPPEHSPGSAPEPAQEPGQPQPPGEPTSPDQLDPEQLRQFQQFQQFQEFLRFSEAQKAGGAMVPGQTQPPAQHQPWLPAEPPPPGGPPQARPDYLPEPRPRPKVPRWLRKLGGKVLGILILVVLLGIAGKLAYNHFFPSTDDNRPASETGGGTYHTNQILSTQPYDAVRQVYRNIAQGRSDFACGRFADAVQQKFATDMNYGNCDLAVHGLNSQVTDQIAYAHVLPASLSETPDSNILRIDSCDFDIQSGPALGVFIVQRVEFGQWLIVGHEKGPLKCPPKPPNSNVPSTPPTR